MTIVKILFGIAAGFVLLMVLIGGGAFLLTGLLDDGNYQKIVDKQKLEGVNFGRTNDQAGCLSEGLKRSKIVTLGSSLNDQIGLKYFLKGCLPESRPTKDFCETVPARYNLPVIDDWETRKCSEAGLSRINSGCTHIFAELINFCSTKDN